MISRNEKVGRTWSEVEFIILRKELPRMRMFIYFLM